VNFIEIKDPRNLLELIKGLKLCIIVFF